MKEAVVVGALRTPIGNHGGGLSSVRSDDLAAHVIAELVKRVGIDPAEIEEVYFGCTNQAGEDSRNVARMATLLAGLPTSVAAVTLNRLCASSLNAINMAARAIKVGEGDVFIAGGVESMSRAPFVMAKAEKAFPWGNMTAYDTTLGWRFPNSKLTDKYGQEGMGETAENVYEETKISREEQDAFSLDSHKRAIDAIDSGRFAEEIVSVTIPQRKGDPIIVDTDERPRRDSTLEALGKLRTPFREGGSVTAGNSSGINDGAAAVMLMSKEKAEDLGIKPLARIVSSAAAGVEPRTMGYGPIPATRKALERAGISIEDIGLVELNEAFAVQSLACMQELGLNHEITNVNGGAVALGHPLGASGARIFTTLIHEMRRRATEEKRPYYGLATLCVGICQGESTIVEWLDD